MMNQSRFNELQSRYGRPKPIEELVSSKQITDCRTKVRYETKRKAKKFAKQANFQYDNDLTVYQCLVCKKFHLTKRVNNK